VISVQLAQPGEHHMNNKNKSRSQRAPFIFVMVAAIVSWGVAIQTSAQKPSELFVNIDASKTDLTPQQQELLNRIRSESTAADTRLVRVRSQLLIPSPINLRVNLGKQFNVMRTETKSKDDSLTWIGKPQSASDAAVLIVKDGNVTGTIRTGDDLYSVRPLGGGLHVIIRQDGSKFPPEHPPNFELKEKKLPTETPTLSTADVSEIPKTLRILVAYTPRVATARPDIESFINLAIAETNLGYTNSHVNIRAELAHSCQVNYQESGNQESDLARFLSKNDSIMDEVHTLRDQYKADVSVLLIDDKSYCGTAGAIMATEDTAFVVVHYECATGYYSFAHEIGHLQGARHNLEMDPEINPFRYGHGYYNQVARWRTIMSYDCPTGCKRLPYWANPDITYGGLVMGTVDNSNDSRVLNETAAIITAFRN
jgi:peptidyl-Asp metalloendopeptidase